MSFYLAAAIQVDLENPRNRGEMERNTARMLDLADMAVEGYAPFGPVRLIVFPEFAHCAPVYETRRELGERLAVEIPNEHTGRMVEKARELDVWIQMGSMLELDRKYPGAVFNTACLVSGRGIEYRYRKVYPWIPWEVHTSPHDIEGYEEEMFPVAETEIGRIGTATCYDWLFPEVLRELVGKGAEVLLRVSAYMDPWGTAEPLDWWKVVNRCRALENVAYVVAANQGASVTRYPPFSWPGGSMIVDYDGRVVVEATAGCGEKIVVGDIQLDTLRQVRGLRKGHAMPAHLRTEVHRVYGRRVFPGGRFDAKVEGGVDEMEDRIRAGKEAVRWRGDC